MQFPKNIQLRDTTLRDGLQNECAFLTTDVKLHMLHRLISAGFSSIEITSFVRPDRIPSLADASILGQKLPSITGIEYRALVPNARGLERFAQTKIDTAVFFLSASSLHNEENVHRSTAQSLQELEPVIKEARKLNRKAVGAIATGFVCPFMGIVPIDDILRVADKLLESGIQELSIADTIGQATPRMIFERSTILLQRYRHVPISLHLHDPHGYGLANVLAGIDAGIEVFDVTQSGLGGCPYAPGAPGNLQAITVARFLEDQGISTGLDLQKLVDLDQEFLQIVKDGGCIRTG